MANLPTISLIAPTPFFTAQCLSGATYTADSLGRISAASNDVKDLLNAGCAYSNNAHRVYTTPGAPAAANSSAVINAQTLTANATLTIAAQPDVPRQLALVSGQGTATLTAGIVTMSYLANDGTTQTDTFNLGTAATASAQTFTTSKGVEHLNSAIVGPTTGAQGSTVTLSVGFNNYLALPLDPGSVNLSVTKETKLTPTIGTLGLMVPADEAVSTLLISTGMISPTQAPDGTHQLSFGYSFQFP
jgi:hypothetical protein